MGGSHVDTAEGQTDSPETKPVRVIDVVGACLLALLPAGAFFCFFALPLVPGPRWLGGPALSLSLLGGLAAPLLTLAYLVAGIALAVGLVVRPRGERPRQAVLVASLLLGLTPAIGLIGSMSRLRMHLAGLLPTRARPLVEALDRYHRAHGKYPATLSELVPAHLAQVPGTGLMVSPEFRYTRADPQGGANQARWLADQRAGYDLSVSCPLGPVGFDSMHYWPSGNYPKAAWGGVTEAVGDWMYVHE
jgi:hypothetical protein